MLNTLIDVLSGIVSKLGELLQYLFVPDENFFVDFDTEMQGIVNDRLPIIGQLTTFFERFFEMLRDSRDTAPVFEISIYGVEKMLVIDFSMFHQYRGIIHGIILAIAYFFFAQKMIKRIPSIIGGF